MVADKYGRRKTLRLSFILVCVACLVFAGTELTNQKTATLYLAVTLYGIAESLRTGSHKAMVLHWLELNQASHRRVDLLASMRFFSKTAAGVAALLAGVCLWTTGRFWLLFIGSAIPALICAGLLTTYPSVLEGEQHNGTVNLGAQAATAQSPIWRHLKNKSLWLILVPSVLYESQIKLVQYYLQPAVASGAKDIGLMVTGGFGAVVVGTYLMASGVLAGYGSILSKPFLKRVGDTRQALHRLHGVTAFLVLFSALAFLTGVEWGGLVSLLTLAALQNMRRPIFLSAADDVMPGQYRATVLSIESQLRSWTYALTSIVTGYVADAFGLGYGILCMGILVVVAWLIDGPGSSTSEENPKSQPLDEQHQVERR